MRKENEGKDEEKNEDKKSEMKENVTSTDTDGSLEEENCEDLWNNYEETENEVNIVYEGQSSNVARVDRMAFVQVKTEDSETSDAASEIVTSEDSGSELNRSRLRLTPLVALIHPATPVSTS